MPGAASNVTVLGCGKGTVLERGLCVAPEFRTLPPAPEPAAPLPDWFGEPYPEANRILDQYAAHRGTIAPATNASNGTVVATP